MIKSAVAAGGGFMMVDRTFAKDYNPLRDISPHTATAGNPAGGMILPPCKEPG